jgi:hypothetical protein
VVNAAGDDITTNGLIKAKHDTYWRDLAPVSLVEIDLRIAHRAQVLRLVEMSKSRI